MLKNGRNVTMITVLSVSIFLFLTVFSTSAMPAASNYQTPLDHIADNVVTDFNREVSSPQIDPNTFVHPLASVIGNVYLGPNIMVAPAASVRADEGQPIWVRNGSNIQDGVILHALETEEFVDGEWEYVENRQFDADGNRASDGSGYGIYIGENVSFAHQSQAHGPAYIGDHTFIGMRSLIFNSKVGSHCVVEPGCTLIGVEIEDGLYVPAGSVVTSPQDVIDKVRPIDPNTYEYRNTNHAVVHVNKKLAAGYLALGGSLPHISQNVLTDFSRTVSFPVYHATTFIHPLAAVIGNVELDTNIMVAPGASVRADEGQPIYVGNASNIQDGVVLHGLETEEYHNGEWNYIENRQFDADGNRVSDGSGYSVYVGKNISIAHQAQLHGPAYVGDHTFIGMKSLIFNSKVGSHCVVEPGSVLVGVEIDDGKYVPAGSVLTSIADVCAIVKDIDPDTYSYAKTNHAVVHVNIALAEGYLNMPGPLDHISSNVLTDFSSQIFNPYIHSKTFVHPLAAVIGNVFLGSEIFVSPGASVRGDEGQPIFVGNRSNIQDGVVLHALETEEYENASWHYIENRQFDINGNRVSDGSGYAIRIGQEVSLAHQAQAHGPVYIGDNTFIGMQSLIFNSKVGSHCVVEPGCILIDVEVEDGMYVPAGSVLTSPQDVAALVKVIDWENYSYSGTNHAVVHVNRALAAGYINATRLQREGTNISQYLLPLQQHNFMYTLPLTNYSLLQFSKVKSYDLIGLYSWIQPFTYYNSYLFNGLGTINYGSLPFRFTGLYPPIKPTYPFWNY